MLEGQILACMEGVASLPLLHPERPTKSSHDKLLVMVAAIDVVQWKYIYWTGGNHRHMVHVPQTYNEDSLLESSRSFSLQFSFRLELSCRPR